MFFFCLSYSIHSCFDYSIGCLFNSLSFLPHLVLTSRPSFLSSPFGKPNVACHSSPLLLLVSLYSSPASMREGEGEGGENPPYVAAVISLLTLWYASRSMPFIPSTAARVTSLISNLCKIKHA